MTIRIILAALLFIVGCSSSPIRNELKIIPFFGTPDVSSVHSCGGNGQPLGVIFKLDGVPGSFSVSAISAKDSTKWVPVDMERQGESLYYVGIITPEEVRSLGAEILIRPMLTSPIEGADTPSWGKGIFIGRSQEGLLGSTEFEFFNPNESLERARARINRRAF